MVRARIEKGEITNQITTGELDTPLLTPCWPAEWMTLLIQILCFPFILIYLTVALLGFSINRFQGYEINYQIINLYTKYFQV